MCDVRVCSASNIIQEHIHVSHVQKHQPPLSTAALHMPCRPSDRLTKHYYSQAQQHLKMYWCCTATVISSKKHLASSCSQPMHVTCFEVYCCDSRTGDVQFRISCPAGMQTGPHSRLRGTYHLIHPHRAACHFSPWMSAAFLQVSCKLPASPLLRAGQGDGAHGAGVGDAWLPARGEVHAVANNGPLRHAHHGHDLDHAVLDV